MGYYLIAQICLNGHVITDSYNKNPEFHQNYCDKCGAETITKCPNCKTNIRGDYEVEGVAVISSRISPAPAYCYNCGNPFPWTKSAIDAAQLLINEDENLNPLEKQQFTDSLPDLFVESPTPKTQVAIVRFKKFLGKAATYTAEGIKDIFVDVASEAIKKSLGF